MILEIFVPFFLENRKECSETEKKKIQGNRTLKASPIPCRKKKDKNRKFVTLYLKLKRKMKNLKWVNRKITNFLEIGNKDEGKQARILTFQTK